MKRTITKNPILGHPYTGGASIDIDTAFAEIAKELMPKDSKPEAEEVTLPDSKPPRGKETEW